MQFTLFSYTYTSPLQLHYLHIINCRHLLKSAISEPSIFMFECIVETASFANAGDLNSVAVMK